MSVKRLTQGEKRLIAAIKHNDLVVFADRVPQYVHVGDERFAYLTVDNLINRGLIEVKEEAEGVIYYQPTSLLLEYYSRKSASN